ncbi:hypothetical protein JSE7799_01999 [Jannaschia seosinensis]|uniref:Uncharacterized protein n=1 Tax=Jannaschia seosinensis TaxID=313367 RepID=A0A0M7BD55_9RHOB|nr:hypothetical protein JSE7799_01999 [Jannaschia seosinensis]
MEKPGFGEALRRRGENERKHPFGREIAPEHEMQRQKQWQRNTEAEAGDGHSASVTKASWKASAVRSSERMPP